MTNEANEQNKNCRHCNKLLPAKRKSFCNAVCRNAHQKIEPTHGVPSRVSGICIVCGQEFHYNISMRPSAVVCSRKCQGIWQTGRRMGLLLKGGEYSCTQSFRQMARKLFIDQCAICGWNVAPCDVAHIIPGINAFDNISMLCPNHHRMYD